MVGSSKIKTGGSPSRAEARPKRCFIPKEYFFAKRLPNSDNPTNSNALSTLDAGSSKNSTNNIKVFSNLLNLDRMTETR